MQCSIKSFNIIENDFAKGLKLYDVFTVLYLLDPESYETILASVRIELHGTLTKGLQLLITTPTIQIVKLLLQV